MFNSEYSYMYIFLCIMIIAGEGDIPMVEGVDFVPVEGDPTSNVGVGEWLHGYSQGTLRQFGLQASMVICIAFYCILYVFVWETKVVQNSPSWQGWCQPTRVDRQPVRFNFMLTGSPCNPETALCDMSGCCILVSPSVPFSHLIVVCDMFYARSWVEYGCVIDF